MEDNLDVVDTHAGADADQQLAVQSPGNARLAEDVLDGGGPAGQEDDLGLVHGRQVVVVKDLEDGRVLPEALLNALGASGGADRGDEARGQSLGHLLHRGRGSGPGRLQGLRPLHLREGVEDAAEDGNAHGTCAIWPMMSNLGQATERGGGVRCEM